MPEPVILVHGLMMRSLALLPLARRLRQRGFDPEFFGYSTLWKVPSVAMEQLAMRLYAMGPGPVHLVAHSLGGLIAAETLNRYQGLPSGKLVCLGSPLAGSSVARGLAGNGLSFVTGKSGGLLRGGLIQIPQLRQVGVIAGAHSLGLGKFFARFDGLNDGTVAVWETRLSGLADHVVIPSSHTGMVYSSLAAELTANFLESGFFRS